MSEAGTGLRPQNAGEYHIGLHFSRGMLQRTFAELSPLLPAFADALTAEDPATTRRTRFRVTVTPRIVDVEVMDSTTNAIALDLDLAVTVTLWSRGRLQQHEVPTSVRLGGGLAFAKDELGPPELHVRLLPPEPDAILMQGSALPNHVIDTLHSFVAEAFEELVEDLERLPVLRFPPRRAGGVEVQLDPAGLYADAATGTLFVGLFTNLRPSRAGTVAPLANVDEDNLLVTFHPDLASAVIKLAVAEGVVPASMDPALEDPLQRAIPRAMHLTSGGFAVDFQTYDLRPGYCVRAGMTLGGAWRLRESGVALYSTEATAEAGSEAAFDGLSSPDQWRRSRFAMGALEVAEQLLDFNALQLGTGQDLALVPKVLLAGEWRVSLELAVAE